MYAGGLVGQNGGTIRNSYAAVTATGDGYVGGLVGVNFRGTILNSYATGEVTGTGSGYVGGLVGDNYEGTIENSYATGAVTAISSGYVIAGGLVGWNNTGSTILNSYATGNVTGTATGSGDVNAGGLVGVNFRGTISNSYATGEVTGTATGSGDVNAGGLVGDNSRGTISNSYFNNQTTGQSVGIGGSEASQTGVTALNTAGLQVLTSATATSWSTNNWDFGNNNQYPTLRSYEANGDNQVQGFIICNQPATHIQCNTTTPALRAVPVDFGERTMATTNRVIISGRNLSGDITLSPLTAPFAYAAGQATTLSPNSDGFIHANISVVFTPTANYQNHASTMTINESSLSEAVEVALAGASIPALEDTDDDNLLEINFIEQLNTVRNNLDGDYELSRNLDFTEASHYASNTVNNAYTPNNEDPSMATNAGFAPIGDNSSGSNATRFTGTFDGKGFTISNLYVNTNSSGTNYAGLFGVTGTGAEVQNLGLVNAYVKAEGTGSGDVLAGGLVGVNSGSTISNSYATGEVTAEGTGSGNVDAGGLVGSNYGTISNSYAAVTATSDGYVGGLVGLNRFSGSIENCYARGKVTATGSGNVWAGGLVGINGGTILNSYATGEVTAEGTGSSIAWAGGLVGSNSFDSSIENCYARGKVTATGSDDVEAGGLVGANGNSGAIATILNSYATGEVTAEGTGSGSVYAGGLVGSSGFRGTISNSNATGEVTATGSGRVEAGGLVGYNFNSGTISNSYATGNVTATATGSGNVRAGGLVGSGSPRNSYATGEVTATGSGNVDAGGLVGSGSSRNSYATGKVTATGGGRVWAGGLVGINGGTILNSYATGEVTAEGTGSGSVYAGGLVGYNDDGTISNSYATGKVTAEGTGSGDVGAGGLVGNNSRGTVTSSYFDNQTTGQSAGIGGSGADQTGVTSLNTAGLQGLTSATATSWSTNNWDFGNTSQYPALRSYKENEGGNQIQGDLFCGQPAPRASTGCPASIAFTATLPAVIANNTYDFGEVATNADATLTYTIAGRDLDTTPLSFSLTNTTGAAFTISSTANVNPKADGTLPSTTITVTFNPTEKARYAATITYSGAGLVNPVVLTFTGDGIIITEINTIDDLHSVRNDLDGNYVLTKNLDFAQGSSYASGSVNTTYRPTGGDSATATNAGWVPIGDNSSDSDAMRFTGSLNGNGFTISNLYVNITADTVCAGLFGVTGTGAEVQNLGLLDAYVKAEGTDSGTVNAGGLAGVNYGRGTIRNSYATGEVTATATDSGFVFAGGLVGSSGSSTILNSYATGEVTARGRGWTYAGGLVGSSSSTILNSYATGEVTARGSGWTYAGGLVGGSSSTISNSYATGKVIATATGSGNVLAGGLVGENYGTIRNSNATGEITATGNGIVQAGGLLGWNIGTISNSYATGQVTATSTGSDEVRAGGLVGSNIATIENSYATGEIIATGTGGDVSAGGLVGWNIIGTISNSYATGEVSGDDNVGGLVGSNFATIRNSYFNSTTTGQTAGVGAGTATGVTARTTAQLQGLTTTATSWSTNNWDFGNTSQYPALRSYKENAGGTQIQGDLFCGQPAPRAGCPAIEFNATLPAVIANNTYDFGDVVANANATLTYTISGENLDASPLTFSLTNTTGNAFTISPTSVTSTAGAISQTVIVTFNPTAEENYEATITHSGAGLSSPVELTLQGTGIAPLTPTPTLSLSSTKLDFGNLSTAASPTKQEYTISGVNLDDGTPLLLSLTNTRGNAFTISPTSVTSIDGTISQTVTVTFTPSTEENYEATITHSGAGLSNPVALTLTGAGVIVPTIVVVPTLPDGIMEISDNVIDFGPVRANDPSPPSFNYTLTGTNLTTDPLIITITGHPAFSINITSITPTGGGLPRTTVTVTFNPTGTENPSTRSTGIAEEIYTATITHTGAGLKEPLLLKLSGTGTADLVGTILGVENTTTAIHLFPNPVTNQLRVQGSGNLQIQVRNISGTTVLSTEIIDTGNLDFARLPVGLYIVSIQSDVGTQAQLILKR